MIHVAGSFRATSLRSIRPSWAMQLATGSVVADQAGGRTSGRGYRPGARAGQRWSGTREEPGSVRAPPSPDPGACSGSSSLPPRGLDPGEVAEHEEHVHQPECEPRGPDGDKPDREEDQARIQEEQGA